MESQAVRDYPSARDIRAFLYQTRDIESINAHYFMTNRMFTTTRAFLRGRPRRLTATVG